MQKTSYELRISDWSSDVCSSDLVLLDSGAEPVSPAIAPASPPCFLHELDDQYLGYASQSACIEFLNLLLEAERAGARVAMRTAAQCSDQQTRTLSRDIQRAEARWCGVLTPRNSSEARRRGEGCDSTCRVRW